MAEKTEPPAPCIRCAKLPKDGDRYCTDCGAPLKNRCFDEPGLLKKGCTNVNSPTAAYCAKCGGPTLFLVHGLIRTANPPDDPFAAIHFWQGR